MSAQRNHHPTKPRKKRAGTHNIAHFNARKMKAKHGHSSWFLIYVENPNVNDAHFFKDFRRRFRLPHCKHKELLCIFLSYLKC